jgi:hypothetical protein
MRKINIPENSVRKSVFDVTSVLDGSALDYLMMLYQLQQLFRVE